LVREKMCVIGLARRGILTNFLHVYGGVLGL